MTDKRYFQVKQLIFLLLILLTTASCAVVPKAIEQPGYETGALEKEIRAGLDRRNGAMNSFEAEADITLAYSGVDYKGQALIVGQGPSSLRLDCLGLFSQPVLSFATDGEHFALISVLAMRYYDGNLSSSAVASLIPGGVQIQDIYHWFLGGFDFKNRRLISIYPHKLNPSLVVMELSNERSGLREEVWLEPSEGVVRRLALKDIRDNELLTAESDGVVKNGDFSYPGTVCFSLPLSGLRLSMAYKKVTLLSNAPSTVFSLPCPPGFRHKTFN
ncbi:MAG: hypothetical protein PHT49_04940 [Desulfovibrionales bacterium]|nr:hypothetical protein [Desulfovibrionales bacterium]